MAVCESPSALNEPSRPQPSRRLAAWRNRRWRGQFYQWLAVLAVLAVVVFVTSNARQALATRGMQLGLGFLGREAGFSLAESVLPFHSSESFAQAFLAGLSNTVWISFVSLILATTLGVLLAIARLSSNWLLSRGAALYIEIFRNTPQLIQIVFWYTVFTLLPSAREALHGGNWWYLSKRGFTFAWLAKPQTVIVLFLALAAGIAGVTWAIRWTNRRPSRSGHASSVMWLSLTGLLVFMVAVWFALGERTAISFPHLAGFNFRGGATLSPEFLALALGLVLYFAAYIAEIVRSGIQSINKGQIEAAQALNLRGARLYRLVILPQALRVVVPPISAQYISLMKTSSLGVAVGYPELFNVTNSIITVSGHTLECVFIMGLTYLLLALLISLAMNGVNRRIALRGARP